MKTAHIAIAMDRNYADYGYIAASSVIESLDPHWHLHLTILDGGIDAAQKDRFKALRSHIVDVAFFDALASTDYAALVECEHWSSAMYYRLSIGEAIPKSATRVLYLDCDILAIESVHELFDLDLGGAWCAAVEEPNQGNGRRLGLPLTATYFNSGVMLFDLNAWRNEGLREQAISIAGEYSDLLVTPDQDILNLLFLDRTQLLECRWNVQSSMFMTRRYWGQISRHCSVIHFTTNSKPWDAGDPHPYTLKYREYARKLNIAIDRRRNARVAAMYVKRFASRYSRFWAWRLRRFLALQT